MQDYKSDSVNVNVTSVGLQAVLECWSVVTPSLLQSPPPRPPDISGLSQSELNSCGACRLELGRVTLTVSQSPFSLLTSIMSAWACPAVSSLLPGPAGEFLFSQLRSCVLSVSRPPPPPPAKALACNVLSVFSNHIFSDLLSARTCKVLQLFTDSSELTC